MKNKEINQFKIDAREFIEFYKMGFLDGYIEKSGLFAKLKTPKQKLATYEKIKDKILPAFKRSMGIKIKRR